jgi:hypothetical protein
MSYMFVPWPFKMTQGYILYHPCVIYVCPSAISNDMEATFYIVPVSYMFVHYLK